MMSALRRTALSIVSVATCLVTVAAVRPDRRTLDRRIVDTAEAGNPSSEAVHGYAGDDVSVGISNGKSYRQTRSWMHYALKTFEDTPVTIACTFVSSDGPSRNYDIVIDDSVIASRTFTAQPNASSIVEIAVPFSLTKGKASVAVIIRARGGPTPALQTIRTIQDHYEFQ